MPASAAGPAPAADSYGTRRSITPAPVVATVAVLLLVILLAALGFTLLRRQGGSSFAGFGVNAVGQATTVKVRPAPDFAVETFGGGPLRLSDLRGQVVVLNFWASWCPPCREEARTLAAVADDYTERGVTFVGVNAWDLAAEGRAFLERYGVRYPNGLDSNGRVTIEYGVTGLPETFVITRDGTLVRKWIGPFSRAQLERFVEEALE